MNSQWDNPGCDCPRPCAMGPTCPAWILQADEALAEVLDLNLDDIDPSWTQGGQPPF